MKANIKITKLDSDISGEEPGHSIGFTINCNNGYSFYVDTVIPYSISSGANGAIKLALHKLSPGIITRVSALNEISEIT